MMGKPQEITMTKSKSAFRSIPQPELIFKEEASESMRKKRASDTSGQSIDCIPADYRLILISLKLELSQGVGWDLFPYRLKQKLLRV